MNKHIDPRHHSLHIYCLKTANATSIGIVAAILALAWLSFMLSNTKMSGDEMTLAYVEGWQRFLCRAVFFLIIGATIYYVFQALPGGEARLQSIATRLGTSALLLVGCAIGSFDPRLGYLLFSALLIALIIAAIILFRATSPATEPLTSSGWLKLRLGTILGMTLIAFFLPDAALRRAALVGIILIVMDLIGSSYFDRQYSKRLARYAILTPISAMLLAYLFLISTTESSIENNPAYNRRSPVSIVNNSSFDTATKLQYLIELDSELQTDLNWRRSRLRIWSPDESCLMESVQLEIDFVRSLEEMVGGVGGFDTIRRTMDLERRWKKQTCFAELKTGESRKLALAYAIVLTRNVLSSSLPK
jgi:hypothetical protein